MAEAVLGELAKSVLKQILSLAKDECKLLRGHKKELKKLEDTVDTIKDVLEDAEQRPPTEAAVRRWLARLKEVMYDAEDVFDCVSYMVLHERANASDRMTYKVTRILSIPKRGVFNYNISKEVKAIRERLDNIAVEMRQFNFNPSQYRNEQPNSVQREQTHSYVPSSEVVGRDQEREDIVKLLLADNFEGKRGVSVVAVIGMGGLGKTTLAQSVYGVKKVQQGFDLCMWCCVNYFSNLKVALEAIIRSATGSAAPERLDVDQLQSLLRNTIGGKRFLLVLDDVWDEDAENWDKLRILLDSRKGGSMVLATMRSVGVAQSMFAVEPYYHLQGLTDEDAWLLFKKIAFGEESEGRSCGDLEQSGRQIVKKCGNAPLAIRVIASMLRHREKKDWFPLVLEELSRAAPNEHGKVMQALKMSYNTLPSPVKRCFAYCSLFPKGEDLDKDKLVRLWIAQGFVEDSVAGQSLEDVAEDYFSCLVNRCFIQNCEEGSSFEMHDLVHDLASDVAGSESILVHEIGPNFGDDTLRHVSLFSNCAEKLSSFSQLKRLRTFLLVRESGRSKIENVKKLVSCFKAVRVLDLSFMRIGKIPDSVGQLIHLRYLDLSCNGLKVLPGSIFTLCHLQYLDLSSNNFEVLPSSIGNLYHLISLKLSSCHRLKELPKEIGKLISLRHLQIRWCGKLSQMPQGLVHMKSLVTLDSLIVHSSSGGLRYLEGLDNLSGSLRIELPGAVWKDAETDAQKACLSKKDRVRELWIEWEKSEVLVAADTVVVMNALQPHSKLESLCICRFVGETMPRWIWELHHLVSLTIKDCRRCVELPSLRHLQFLKVLKISRMSLMVVIEEDGIGRTPDDPDSIFFPSLETLSIREMPNLESWWKQAPPIQLAFPSVTKVTIRGCPKLTSCMPWFPHVEDLQLSDIQETLFQHAFESDGTNKLKMLKLGSIHGLGSLSGAGIRNLTSLQELAIFNSKEVYLSWGVVLGLPHLRILKFHNLEKVIDVGSDDVQRHPSSPLQELVIESTSGEWLEGIPWRSFPSLRSLRLDSIANLEALPQGIQHLTALQDLQLWYCKSVVSLPHWMTSLSSLCSLHIHDCSKELKERCKRLTGEDWPNIQHIPLIKIDSEVI